LTHVWKLTRLSTALSLQILKKLSDQLPLAKLVPYLSLVFQSQSNAMHNRRIELNLRKAEDLQVWPSGGRRGDAGLA